MPVNQQDGSRQYLPVEKKFYTGLTFRMCFGLGLFLLAVLAVNYFVIENRGRHVIVQQSDKLNDELGRTITLSLREKLSAAESLGRSLARLAEVTDAQSDEYMRIVPELLNQNGMENMIAGGGIWPEPFVFDPNKERASFFWARNAEGILEFLDDYNKAEGRGYHREEWYVPVRFLDPKKVYWSKSYRDPHSMESMVTCSVPIIKNGKFKGVATVDLKLAGLSDFMQTKSRLMGGYAFALDRNNRLLSLPSTDQQKLTHFDISQYAEEAYPTIQALVEQNDALRDVQSELNRVSIQQEVNLSLTKAQDVDILSQKIVQASDQIQLDEARKISRIILDTKSYEQFSNIPESGKRLDILYDPLLKEASSVSVIHMPDIGWKVVVAMPARYTSDVVAEITEGMMGLLFILLAIAALLYLLFFNSVFLLPVNKLTQQIRSLVSREDYVTMLNIKGSDELAQLASWFNIRTSQLAEAFTSLKYRNNELSEAREIAEQANRSKNIFLASMSHDIRTPMNAIIGLSDVLKKTPLQKDQSQYVQVINSSAQSLLSLINDIMDFSKIEANQLDLESISFDLRRVLDDCADLIFFQANEKRLEFVYFVSPNIPKHVVGDPNRLRQIILNLACNAVKFTEAGRIEFWVETLAKQENTVQLLIEIRDTGIGLSKSAQQKIFTPFVQADTSTTRKYGGTGLGLAISKHLADLMGGVISFRSEENIGTTFSLKMKMELDLEKQAVLVNSDKLIEQKSVIIFGQNHFQNTVLENYLTSMGCPVIIATSVQTWLDQLQIKRNVDFLTICSDFDLLGEISAISSKLSVNKQPFDFLCFANQSERYDAKFENLIGKLNIRFASYPIKYEELQKFILSFNHAEHISGNEKIGDIQRSHLPLSMYRNKRLLIVEDNKVNQQVLTIMLGYLGLQAEIANDGVEALETIKNNDYDLVLMDWQMPRMDGLEATRKVRLLKDIDQPVIIAVTANAMSGDIEKCLQSGMNDYLSKPIGKDKLELMLRRWLSSE